MSASSSSTSASGLLPTQVSTSEENRQLSSAQTTKKIACAVCRKRKLKCDGIRPACGTCARLQHDCTYEETTRRKGGPKRGYVKMLEERLGKLSNNASFIF